MTYPKYRIVDTWTPTSMDLQGTMFKAQVKFSFFGRWQNIDVNGRLLASGFLASGPFGVAADACTKHWCRYNLIDYNRHQEGNRSLDLSGEIPEGFKDPFGGRQKYKD